MGLLNKETSAGRRRANEKIAEEKNHRSWFPPSSRLWRAGVVLRQENEKEKWAKKMEELNPNHLETFLCAKRDKETKRSIIKLFVLFYFVFAAITLFGNLIIVRKGHPGLGLIVMPLFYATLLVALSVKNVRHYTIDYKNSIVIDMGSCYEIISSQDIAGTEVLDRKKSFEFIQSSKFTGYIGTYQTKTHGTIKAVATNRDHFVLIKTKTGSNYVISPEEPEKFIEFMTGRLGICEDANV
jgi:hypothetical protein